MIVQILRICRFSSEHFYQLVLDGPAGPVPELAGIQTRTEGLLPRTESVAFRMHGSEDRPRVQKQRGLLRYIAVAAGQFHTLLLCADGNVLIRGSLTRVYCTTQERLQA